MCKIRCQLLQIQLQPFEPSIQPWKINVMVHTEKPDKIQAEKGGKDYETRKCKKKSGE